MRASLSKLTCAIHASKAPREIRQESWCGDPEVLKRLCGPHSEKYRDRYIGDYSHVIRFSKLPIQADLFRYLLPMCLEIWTDDVLQSGLSGYAGWVEAFWAALGNRPLLQTQLTEAECNAVGAYMADVILERIEQELPFPRGRQCGLSHALFCSITSYCIVFPRLEPLWRSWWEMTTTGQARASVHYATCLMYDQYYNPVFSPWTPDGGGGPPCLWEPAGHIYDHGWHEANIAFIVETLTVDYLHEALKRAEQRLKGAVDAIVPSMLLKDYEQIRPLMERRLAELPKLLNDLDPTAEWTV